MDPLQAWQVGTSRRGLRPGDVDRDGQLVVQVCPDCRGDWLFPRVHCLHCGAVLPPPWVPGGRDRGAAARVRWVWLAAGVAQMCRIEARMGARIMQMVRDS